MQPAPLLAALVGVVVGATGVWLLKPESAAPLKPLALAASEPHDAPGQRPALGSDATVLRAALEKARTELGAEREMRAEAERKLAQSERAGAALREAAAKGTAPDAPQVAAGVRYTHPKFAKALAAIDWDVAGDALAHMNPLLKELAAALEAGKPMPPSVGQIQRYNGPLVTAALQAQQSGMPGTGVNGSFTHVSMLANMLYATLLKAGKPLDEKQEAVLREVADDLIKEDERRLTGYGEDAFALEKLIDETALKDRFYAAVDRVVTDEQREILHPANLRGRVAFDLFSSGLVWATVLAPQRFTTVEGLKQAVVALLVRRAQIAPEHQSLVEDLAGEWAKGFPRGYLEERPDALAAGGRMKVERVRIAAKIELALLRALVQRLPADAPAAAKLRQEQAVLVPLRQ